MQRESSRFDSRLKEVSDIKKEFSPKIEVFDPFKVPFSSESEVVFDIRDMDACCACTACTACSACK